MPAPTPWVPKRFQKPPTPWNKRYALVPLTFWILATYFNGQSAILSQFLTIVFGALAVVGSVWAVSRWWKDKQPAKAAPAPPIPPIGNHDLALATTTPPTTLAARNWRKNTPIAIGRELGISAGRAWFPHALIVGATGSGKTTLLRPFVRRWTGTGPAAVMSTKGDIIPDALLNQAAGTIHLVTPSGRDSLDRDGQARLSALEAAGWTVLDTRWDPVIWAGKDVRDRAGLIGRCLSDVIGDEGSSSAFWTSAAAGLISAGIILEAAAIKAEAPSWSTLLEPAPMSGSEVLFRTSTSTSGVERLVQELSLEKLTLLAKIEAAPPIFSPIEQSAVREVLETARLLAGNNVTALSRYQTAAIALAAYAYPDEGGRPPLDVAKWANSDHDLLVVVVPSAKAKEWAAPMACLALALWTEASAAAGDHLIVLDEMASLAPVPEIASWTAQGRGLGVHVVAVLQSESQAKRWDSHDTSGWLLNNWPVLLVASGTPTTGLATHLATGEGQHETETVSITQRPDENSWRGGYVKDGETRSTSMRDRIEPNAVFDQAVFGVWRVIDRRVGPWAVGIQ